MSAAAAERRVFLVGTLIDGTGGEPIRNAAILMEGERIAAVGPRASVAYDATTTEVVDASSHYAIPGLIDSHCHLFLLGDVTFLNANVVMQTAAAIRNAAIMLDMGVTTIRDVGAATGNPDIQFREVLKAGLVPGPRMFTSGDPLMATAGHMGGTLGIEVDGPIEARHAARRQLSAGADLLKLFATAGIGGNGHSRSGQYSRVPPHLRTPRPTTGGVPGWCQLTVEEMSVMVEEAHKVRATVACHAIGIEGIRNSLAAGVDTIEHGTGLDEAAIETMVARGVALVPTMSILHTISYHGRDWDYPQVAIDNSRVHYEEHVIGVGRAHAAGVKIAAGTDVIDNDTVAMECAQLVKAGMTPMEAIVAATRTGAELLKKEHDFGTVQVGRRADLVLLGGDPLADIRNLENVQMVVQDGRTVDRSNRPRAEVLAELKGVF